jgi:glycosyltransferase involved in cell wall biosynthesis
MGKNKVVFLTWAYNAQATLRDAVESVLSQTFSDFEYRILDNGSSDGTWDIIRDFADKDPRVRCFHREKNMLGLPILSSLLGQLSDSDYTYLAQLDADDEYAPDFLEKSLALAEAEQCGIVCCGSDFTDAKTGKVVVQRRMFDKWILKGKLFTYAFPRYYQFARTVWGKLYRRDVIEAIDFDELNKYDISNGMDTLFALAAFAKAECVGILPGTSHKHRVNQSSASAYSTWNRNRERSYSVIFDASREFLINKSGKVSPVNDDFLYAVYLDSLVDVVPVLLGASNPQEEKIDAMYEMLMCEHTRELAAKSDLGVLCQKKNRSNEVRKMFAVAAKGLMSFEGIADGQSERYCELGEFLCGACEDVTGTAFYRKTLVRYLIKKNRIDEARAGIDDLLGLLPDDAETAELAQSVNKNLAS